MRKTSHNQVALSYERFSGQTHPFWTKWDTVMFFLKVFPFPASDLDSCNFVELPATEPCSVENAVWI